MKIKKLFGFLVCLFSITGIAAQTDASEKEIIANIRRQYAEMHEIINHQKEDVQQRNNAVLTFNHNVPGIGAQTFKYELFFTPYESSINMNYTLRFVQCSYNVAARKYYEEFLYDADGELLFMYARRPDDSGEMLEMRCYMYDHLILKMTVTKQGNGKSQTLFEGRAADGSIANNLYDFNSAFAHETDARSIFKTINEASK